MTTYQFPFRDVVLVADILDESAGLNVGQRRDLECTHRSTLEKIRNTLQGLDLRVHHYQTPKELAEHADLHTKDIVLSIYGGSRSRNRMALVPAVCETFGLCCVGPDTYGRIIAQDKEVSKALAAEAGFQVATHRIVRSHHDLVYIENFPTPYVAKPLLEGSSIGIEPRNLIESASIGLDVVVELLNDFSQPVMVEEFIPGREVNWCFIEHRDGVRDVFTEFVWAGDPHYFDHHLFDAALKLDLNAPQAVHNVSHELHPDDARSMREMLALVGGAGYGRIDGKLRNGRFVFLEITPDAWLDPSGTFVEGFRSTGMQYEDVMALILLSTNRGPQGQSPNG